MVIRVEITSLKSSLQRVERQSNICRGLRLDGVKYFEDFSLKCDVLKVFLFFRTRYMSNYITHTSQPSGNITYYMYNCASVIDNHPQLNTVQ